MHLYLWAILSFILIGTSNAKFGGARGGGFGRASGGFRGSSAARSSIFGGSRSSGSGSRIFSSKNYGGSFKSSSGATNSFRTRKIGSSSYYVPMSGLRSRDTFRSSFRSSFMGGMLGYMAGRAIIRSTMGPMYINSYYYNFDRPTYGHVVNGKTCAVEINKIDSNDIPFDTTIYADNSTNDQIDIDSSFKDVENSTDTQLSLNDDFKFSDLAYEDGHKPKQIVWSCPNSRDRCCYMECCPEADDDEDERALIGYSLVGVALIVLFLLWASNRSKSGHRPMIRT